MSYVKEAHLRDAYTSLKETVRVLELSQMDRYEAKIDLEVQKASVIAEGLEGKNQAERDANLTHILADATGYYERTDKRYIKAKSEAELAKLELRMLQDLMRLAELELKEAEDE